MAGLIRPKGTTNRAITPQAMTKSTACRRTPRRAQRASGRSRSGNSFVTTPRPPPCAETIVMGKQQIERAEKEQRGYRIEPACPEIDRHKAEGINPQAAPGILAAAQEQRKAMQDEKERHLTGNEQSAQQTVEPPLGGDPGGQHVAELVSADDDPRINRRIFDPEVDIGIGALVASRAMSRK